jgi:hypothetical protein
MDSDRRNVRADDSQADDRKGAILFGGTEYDG